MNPLVSVIVVSTNERHRLERLLPTLTAGLDGRTEILVVDHASTDGTAAFVRERFPQARVVEAGRNLGYAGGNNLGAAHARGEYLAVLNPDTEVDSGWLEPLLAALAADPHVGLVTAQVRMLRQPDRLNTCGNEVQFTGMAWCRGLGLPVEQAPPSGPVPAVSGCAFLIRRQLFLALGGFDEDYFMYLEDTDLSLRARLAGYDCRYVAESRIWHDYALKLTPRKYFHLERNRLLTLLKLLSARSLALLVPALLLTEAVAWGYAALRGPAYLAAKGRSWWWLLRHHRAVLAKRRAAQRLRRVGDGELWRVLSWRTPAQALLGPGARGRAVSGALGAAYGLLYGVVGFLIGAWGPWGYRPVGRRLGAPPRTQ